MAHKVTLQPSGNSFEVPEGTSILNAAIDAGRMIPYSCRVGMCRTCRGVIKEGKVDYGNVHEMYLPAADKARGFALLCQAKPLTDLVVEVREVKGMRPRLIPCRLERLGRAAAAVPRVGVRLPRKEDLRVFAPP